jgi:hypothetical protein
VGHVLHHPRINSAKAHWFSSGGALWSPPQGTLAARACPVEPRGAAAGAETPYGLASARLTAETRVANLRH